MKRFDTKILVRMAMMVAVTAVCAQLVIPIPMTAVYFSLSVVAVFLTGALLPPGAAAAAQLVYILLGLAGAPVFGRFSGGLSALLGPTGGYILAYPLMALLVAWAARLARSRQQLFWMLALGMLAALLVCYALGTVWLAKVANMTMGAALMAAVVPFVAVDLAKIVLSALLGRMLRPLLERGVS